MNNDNFIQIQKDIERLTSDVKNLVGDGAINSKRLCEESVDMFHEAMERCADVGHSCIKTSEDLMSRANNCVQHRPLLSLGVAALLGGIAGVIISRRSN